VDDVVYGPGIEHPLACLEMIDRHPQHRRIAYHEVDRGGSAQTMLPDFRQVELLVVDVEGTLTNAKIAWAGPEIGWTEVFSVRDGEAIRRLTAAGIPVVPLSRNPTECAKARMRGLNLPTTWLGVRDKVAAFESLRAEYEVVLERIAYVADGLEDAPILRMVGVPCAVADAHRTARAVAKYITTAVGGEHAVEEVIERIWEARGWVL
jgi:3-deoxy-D-manno-octulosonate 8-phosphate phosphatase (KDO 8-P phosphatase)